MLDDDEEDEDSGHKEKEEKKCEMKLAHNENIISTVIVQI
jgi:hypothetical protein